MKINAITSILIGLLFLYLGCQQIITPPDEDTADKAITWYFFMNPGTVGTINESAKTISVIVPYSTNMTALIAFFTTTGASVKVGTTTQISGVTPNNFTNPVVYTVVGSDNSTTNYKVIVNKVPHSAKAITSFLFTNPVAVGTINESAKTILVTVPNSTDVTALVSFFTTTGASVKVGTTTQISGVTPNNFTNPVVYTVTAENNSTEDYTVTVQIASTSDKAITSYYFTNPAVIGTINESAKTIALTVPFGTNITSLVATFTTTGANVKVGSTTQISGSTTNDFTNPVVYTVTAADSSTANYTVTVSVPSTGDTWASKANMPTARSCPTSNVVNGVIYAIGGAHYMQVSGLNTVEAYDPTSNTWSSRASMPSTRYAACSAEVNGIIYVFGGLRNGSALNTVEAYNPSTNTWSTKTSMPTARSFATSSAVNGIIYVIGGCSPSGGYTYFNTVEAYDTTTNTWSTKASMPTARANSASCIISGIIYVIGGDTAYQTLNIMEAYNPSTNTWSTKAPMPTARVRLGASVANGIIYAIGGFNGTSAIGTVEAYDPTTGTWNAKNSMPAARWELTASEVNNIIYAIGGSDINGYDVNTVEAYTP